MRAVVRLIRRLGGARRRRSARRPLADTIATDYGVKLEAFAAFAARELERLVQTLPLPAGGRVLEAGCGTGALLPLLRRQVGPQGLVVGLDLSRAHLSRARTRESRLAQGDFERLPFGPGVFDAICVVNALNHAERPSDAVDELVDALAPAGTLAIVQSAVVPDMMFAWDLRLERVVREACLRAYRDLYGLRESDTASVRRLVGLLRDARLLDVTAATLVIERLSPLTATDERYLHETVFEGYWGQKLKPYLTRSDWKALSALCDPASRDYALRRPDFHHLQTLTLVHGRTAHSRSPSESCPTDS